MESRVIARAVFSIACWVLAVAPVASLRDGAGKETEVGKVGHFVIVCYRPKVGKEAALLELIREHVPILRTQGLVTDRPAYAMRAKDGTIVEVFEWKSVKATDEAHANPAVQALWKRFGEVCDYDAIGNLPEAKQLFSGFEAIDLES